MTNTNYKSLAKLGDLDSSDGLDSSDDSGQAESSGGLDVLDLLQMTELVYNAQPG